MTNKFYYKSPIGVLEITLDNGTVIGLKVVESCSNISERSGFFEEVAKQLDEYFAGTRSSFDLKITLKGTDFQKKVWNELRKIPYGKTKSYQEIAETIGNPNAQRAIGSACNKNPILLIIPCHRVISKSGNLKGFSCGLKNKEYLQELEKFKLY